MTVKDDLRALAEIDTHHGSLREVSDDIMDRWGLTVLVQKHASKPIVVAAVRKEVCPIDPTITFQVKFWLVDITQEPKVIQAALRRSMTAIGVEMEKAGAMVGWGWIPLKGRHLIRFLDSLEEAGVGRWEDNDNAPGLDEEEIRQLNSYGRFFIAELAKAKVFV